MSVAGMPVARQDFVLYRGSYQGIDVRWRRDLLDGSPPEPVNLLGREGVCVLTGGPQERELLRRHCRLTSDGHAIADIPAAALSDKVFDRITTGKWRTTLAWSGRTRLLGWGFWTLA